MRVRVVAALDDERDPLVALARDYLARAGKRYDAGLVVVKTARRAKGGDDQRARDDEGKALLEKSAGTTRVALDERGKTFTSRAFAERLEALLVRGQPVAFLVGGPSGHGDALRAAVDETWSLSPLTFPHRLALVVLAEQIYRAHEIERGGPYAR